MEVEFVQVNFVKAHVPNSVNIAFFKVEFLEKSLVLRHIQMFTIFKKNADIFSIKQDDCSSDILPHDMFPTWRIIPVSKWLGSPPIYKP